MDTCITGGAFEALTDKGFTTNRTPKADRLRTQKIALENVVVMILLIKARKAVFLSICFAIAFLFQFYTFHTKTCQPPYFSMKLINSYGLTAPDLNRFVVSRPKTVPLLSMINGGLEA